MSNYRRTAGLLAAGTAMSVIASAAHAQATDTKGAAPNAPTTEAEDIPDIVVTAQRREERLQNVPIAITALTQETLTKSDTVNLSRVANFTPGFNFGQSGFDTRPAIRGVRTDNIDGNGDTTIGFYVDDIYQSLPVQAGQPFIDVARVEIARGPQGTLFGRNTFGGAVSVVSQLPTKDFDYGADLTVGNYGRVAARGFVNLPVSQTFGLRVAGYREKRDAYVKNFLNPGNDINDRDSSYVRGTAEWNPTDQLQVILRGTYWREGGTGAGAYGYKSGGLLVDPVTGLGDLNGVPLFFISARPKDGIPDINGIDVGTPDSDDPYEWGGAFKPRARLNEYATSAQIRWSNDSIFVRSISSFTDFDYNSNTGESFGSPSTEYVQVRNTKTYTQELQVGGVSTKPLQWVAGLYYFDDKYFDNFVINDIGYNFNAEQTIHTKSYAAYGQVSYNVIEAFRLTAGGRYTIDDKGIDAHQFDNFADYGSISTGRKFKKFTWRLGADYQLTPANLLYASVSTGFRSGGFNAGALSNSEIPETFDPEKVTAYEIGSKNRFGGNKYQLNLSAYYNDFKDLQLQNQFALPAPSVSVISAVLNAGSARAKGLEIEAIARPMPALTLNLAAAIVDAKFEDYSFNGRPSRFYPVGFQDLSGNDIPHTPPYKVTLGAEYAVDVPGIGTFTPRGTLVFSGRYYNTDYNTVLDRQKAYTTADLGLGWTSPDERFGIDAFVNNVSNKAILNYAAFGSATLITSYEQPRFYGVRFSIRR